MFENLSLNKIDKILENRMKNCELISDINLSRGEYEELLAQVVNILKFINNGNNLELLVNKSPLVFASVLVYIAMYEYDGNYWEKTKEILEMSELSQQSRTILAASISIVINKYKLKRFDNGGYKYVTPIMCHSGIPNKSLSGIFDIMLDNYNNSTLTAEALIDNIKYFIRHKVDSTVYRFITFNEERAITFLHDLKDLVTVVEDNGQTLSETLSKYNYLDERIITQYFKWRKQKDVSAERKQNRNRISSPKIKFDAVSLGIYLYLPVQHIHRQYNDCIEWNIEYDNGETINFSGELYYQNKECISEEQNIALNPSTVYKINLTYDGDTLAEWIYDGVCEEQPYIIFDEDDNFIKGNKIFTKCISIILREDYKIIENKLALTYFNLPNKHWYNFKCISVTLLEDINSIGLISKNKELRIDYKKISVIELQSGKLLFNESFRRDEIPMYSGILPKLSLEYENNFNKNIIIDTYSLAIMNLKENINLSQSINSLDLEIIGDKIKIDLNDLEVFKNNIFGEYELRVFEGRNIKRSFTLRYLPMVDINEDNIQKWPKDIKGYLKNSFKILCPDNVVFNFTDCIQEEVLYSNNIKNIYIESISQAEFLMGTIDIIMPNKIITFPVKKKIRNLLWALIQEGDKKILWLKEPNTIFIKDLMNNNYNIALKLNDDKTDEYIIKLYLLDNKDRVIQEKIFNLKRDKLFGVSLNQFLDSIKYNDFRRYFIKLEAYDKYNSLLCSFIPIIIKDKVTVRNIRYISDESGFVTVSWEQDGKIDRETMALKLYNITRPWKEGINIPLDEHNFTLQGNICSLVINSNEFQIKEDGVYLFEIEDCINSEDFFVEDDKKNNFIRISVNSVYKYKNNYKEIVDRMEINTLLDGIFYFVYCYDTKDIKIVLNKIRALKITEDYSINLLKSIYTVFNNRHYFIESCNQENAKIVKYIIKLLMAKFESNFNSFKIIEDLIDIDANCISEFFEYINRHNLKVNAEYIIPIEKRSLLWNIDKERSFMIETRSGRVSKNILINNIIDWINIHNIKEIFVYGEQCKTCSLLNNKGCLNKYIKGKCQEMSLNLSPKLMGSRDEYDKLFNNIDINDYRKLNKLDSLNLLDYFEDDGIRLFDKSYVEILYKWSNENGLDVRNKIFAEIKEYTIILNNYIEKEVTNSYFNNLYKAFFKRKDNSEKSSNTLAYYLGVVVLIMALDSYNKIVNKMTKDERKSITRLYNLLRNKLNELFKRDFVLVELYVTGLGE